MITSFVDLLHPHDPSLLLAAAASGQRLLLRTDRASEFARLLPWDALNDLITPEKVLAGEVQFARNNAILPAEMTILRPKRQKPPTRMRSQTLEQYASQGVSVIVSGLHRMDRRIERMNAIIEREFRASVQTNAYASFSRDSAFHPHWDEHNVMVLQLQGRKHWRCWGQPWQSPISQSDCPVPPDPGSAEWETVLEPGDVLYLPRGEVHAAHVLEGENSLHLTIGIIPPRIDALTAALARLCEEEPLGRQDLPILSSAAQRDAWMAEAKALLRKAVDRLDLDQVLASLDRMQEPLPSGFLGLNGKLSSETVVICALRRRLALAPSGTGAFTTVTVAGQSWTITALEKDVLDQLQRHHARTLSSLRTALPGHSEADLCDAIRALSGKGLARLLDG